MTQQEIKRSGRVPEKQILFDKVKALFRGVKSPKELKTKLEQNGIKCYERNGKLTGIWNERGTRKYRLKGLGVGIHHLDRSLSLDNKKQRKKDIKRERLRW